MLQIEQIFIIDSCDDPAFKVVGFFCLGHISHSDFIKSNQLWEYIDEYNEDNDLDKEEQLKLQSLPLSRHIYWVIEKEFSGEPDCNCEIFVRCSATRPGAIAVTVLDV